MTIVNLHGILGQEYGRTFKLNLSNPRHVLEAIDCSKTGFIKRVISLHTDGLGYEIIVDRKKLSQPSDIENISNVQTIDLVPIIAGSSGFEALILAGLKKAFFAIVFATIQYALTPKPEVDSLEIQADANKSSLVFIAITISSSAALPALSPIPLIVHSICLTPADKPDKAFATANPRSLWQWAEIIALSILGTLFNTDSNWVVALLTFISSSAF